jgi:ribosomal protein S18 acetylase RimI-like enzyme
MIVERATEDDLAEIYVIDNAFGTSNRFLYIDKAVKEHGCYIAREGGAIIGFAVLTRHFFGEYFIELLVVHPDHYRKGVGTSLLRHIEKILPAEKLFTSTNVSNLPMQALCKTLGFVVSGWVDNLDEGDPEIIYFKRINLTPNPSP